MLQALIDFIDQKIKEGPLPLDELQSLFIPIFNTLNEIHDNGFVKPDLTTQINIEDEVFKFKTDNTSPKQINKSFLLISLETNKPIAPLANFQSPELNADHHDELSDIYQIGLIFASLALAMPLYKEESRAKFYLTEDIQSLAPNIHPIVKELVLDMTNLERNKRATNLGEISLKLQFAEALKTKKKNIWKTLSAFQNQLYDFSKKSSILYAKEKSKQLAIHKIATSNQNTFIQELTKNTAFDFTSLMTDENKIKLSYKLKTIQNESIKDRKKLGFSNLKLAIGNLSWSNIEDKEKSIQTGTLFYLQVEFIKDVDYTIKVLSPELEINPVLRHHFNQQYNIHLPTKLQLSELNNASISNLLQTASKDTPLRIKWQQQDAPQTTNDTSLTWTYNLAYTVLGNFNYKKVSLTKDYEFLLDKKRISILAESLLSTPADSTINHLEELSYQPEDLFNITSTDPSQDQAIVHAITGSNFVIQGPPGTGKSQTITNIISNFLAQDKKVLFVSSKRTALDTVYKKLVSANLDDIASIIYDSQADKQAFIEGLNQAYQAKNERILNLESIKNKRNTLSTNIHKTRKLLDTYKELLSSTPNGHDRIQVHQLYELVIQSENSNTVKANTPHNYALWQSHGEAYTAIFNASIEKEIALPFKQQNYSLLSLFSWQLLAENKLQDKFDRFLEKGKNCSHYITQSDALNPRINTIADYQKLLNDLHSIVTFSSTENLQYLNSDSKIYTALVKAINEQEKTNEDYQAAVKKTAYWHNKLTEERLQEYLHYLQEMQAEKKLLFSPKYFEIILDVSLKTKSFIALSKTKLITLLKELQTSFDLEKQIAKQELDNNEHFGTNSLQQLKNNIDNLRHNLNPNNLNFALQEIEQERDVSFSNFLENLEIFRENLNLIDCQKSADVNTTLEKLKAIPSNLFSNNKIAKNIVAIYSNEEAKDYFLSLDVAPKEIAQKLAKNSIESFHKKHPDYRTYTNTKIQASSKNLAENLKQLQELNQHYIQAKQNDYFQTKLRLSSLSNSNLNAKQLEEKRVLVEGKKVLENEFQKTRNLKSIRELNEGPAQSLIFDLKPLWLMSPTSVSDILPITENLFDLIIFDEASQVEIEESIPAIYRSKQCIIVGDKMQMPPSTFFKKNKEDTTFVKQHESILHLAEKNWPHINLRWHYRSKNDSLIHFNNSVFYHGQLNTIPNVKLEKAHKGYFEVTSINEAAFNYESIRENAINFHFINKGIFEERKNIKEANYIAELVKHLLLSKKDLNLGIIALSKEQENAISKAIKAVKYFDKTFEDLLTEKTNAQKFLQDIFVRNVENIQGQERDLIIVSVGHGFNSNGDFTHNFGPINQQGGERRLNVLFSRAKRNLLLVSSITHEHITNEHNLGIKTLKNYLKYAEKVAKGKKISKLKLATDTVSKSVVKEQQKPQLTNAIKLALEEKSYLVKTNYGNSNFTCNLAVKKKKNSKKYSLAIFIDDASFYQNSSHFSFAQKQEILAEFSWQTYTVIGKNWLEDKDEILKEICALIEQESEEKKIAVKKQSSLLKDINYKLAMKDLLFTRLIKPGAPDKFWQVAGKLSDVVIQYGKVGSKGKTLIKSYANVAEVIKKKRSLIKQKEKNGYKRV